MNDYRTMWKLENDLYDVAIGIETGVALYDDDKCDSVMDERWQMRRWNKPSARTNKQALRLFEPSEMRAMCNAKIYEGITDPFRALRELLNTTYTKLDSEEVRDNVDFIALLHSYMPDIRIRGSRATGRCPIHQGDSINTFSADVDKKVWNCFKCNEGGDVFTLIERMEDCSFVEALKIANETV